MLILALLEVLTCAMTLSIIDDEYINLSTRHANMQNYRV